MTFRTALTAIPLLAGLAMLTACTGSTGLVYGDSADASEDAIVLPDGGPPPPPDAGPKPKRDAGPPPAKSCTTPIGTTCAVGSTCYAGSCGDEVPGSLECACEQAANGSVGCVNTCDAPIPDGGPGPCNTMCPPNEHHDPATCDCVPDDAGVPACAMTNGELCPPGATCDQGLCNDVAEVEWCTCFVPSSGPPTCSTWCGTIDSGLPVCPVSCPADYEQDPGTCGCRIVLPPPPPPPAQCYIANYGYCDVGTSCTVGYCPDDVTPITCFCTSSESVECTGGCPPAPVPPIEDGGIVWAPEAGVSPSSLR